MAAVYWKELADYFGNRLFAVVLLSIAVAAAWAAYTTTQDLREQAAGLSAEVAFLKLFTTQGDTPLSFLFFVGFFGPLLGLALGFDAVNSERARGTLGRILAQPIYRDALINGKFLAGATVLGISLLSLILIVIGIGLYTLGIAPSTDEAVRLTFFLGATLIYMALWLSLSILFSLLFDRAVMSALASIGVWLALTFFIPFFAVTIADQLVPDSEDAQSVATERASMGAAGTTILASLFVRRSHTTTAEPPGPHTRLRQHGGRSGHRPPADITWSESDLGVAPPYGVLGPSLAYLRNRLP